MLSLTNTMDTKLVIDWAGENVTAFKRDNGIQEVICHMTCVTSDQFCDLLGELGTAVRVIDLTGSGFNDSVLERIAKCDFPQLRVFRIGNCEFSNKGVVDFLEKRGESLCELDLSGFTVTRKHGFSEIAKLTPNLTTVNVSRTAWEPDAMRYAFQRRWTQLLRLEARGCTGFALENACFWPAIKTLKYLDLRGTPVDYLALLKVLPEKMTHIFFDKVSADNFKTLGTKLPSIGLGASKSKLTNKQFIQAMAGSIKEIDVSHCPKLNKAFFAQLAKRSLTALWAADTSITAKHILALQLKDMKKLDLADCKGLTDAVLKKMKFPSQMDELSLKGTAVTLKGVVNLLNRCQIDRLTLPSESEFVVNLSGQERWTDAQFRSLLPHISRKLERISLHALDSLSYETWSGFIRCLPKTITSIVIEKCGWFCLSHLKAMLQQVPSPTEITLSGLYISGFDAMQVVQGRGAEMNLELPKEPLFGEARAFEVAVRQFRRGEYESAVQLFQKKCDQKDLKVQCYLGFALHNGWGIEQDEKSGREIVGKAANKGIPDAQILYGRLLCEDFFMERIVYLESETFKTRRGDLQEGLEWLEKQIDQQNPDAMYWKAHYMLKSDPASTEGKKLLEMAIAEGHKEAEKYQSEMKGNATKFGRKKKSGALKIINRKRSNK